MRPSTPVAFSHFGAMSDKALELINRLGKKLGRTSAMAYGDRSQSEARGIRYLQRRISVLLQKRNVAFIRDRQHGASTKVLLRSMAGGAPVRWG